MATTWIVAADAARARLLQSTGPGQPLEELEDMLNPEARVHGRDLRPDAHPHFSGRTGNNGAVPRGGAPSDRQAPDVGEIAAGKFAKQVAARLEEARQQRRYDRLQIAAAPRFLGMLRKELSSEVRKLVTQEVPKDFSALSERELGERLK